MATTAPGDRWDAPRASVVVEAGGGYSSDLVVGMQAKSLVASVILGDRTTLDGHTFEVPQMGVSTRATSCGYAWTPAERFLRPNAAVVPAEGTERAARGSSKYRYEAHVRTLKSWLSFGVWSMPPRWSTPRRISTARGPSASESTTRLVCEVVVAVLAEADQPLRAPEVIHRVRRAIGAE